jgi:uncharacterized protein involved in cysteine biosynthesis
MFRAKPAGPASEADRDGRSASVSRAHGRHFATGARKFVMDVRGLFVRVLQLVVSIVVLTIVAGILLVLLKANPANSIVSEVHSWARWLAGPFDGMFSLHSANDAIAVNWGIAAFVYLIVGGLIARLFNGSARDRRIGRSSYPNQEIS